MELTSHQQQSVHDLQSRAVAVGFITAKQNKLTYRVFGPVPLRISIQYTTS